MTTTVTRSAAFIIFAVAVGFVISLAGSSVKSTVQVLFLPIADGFDISRGTLAIAFTLFALVNGLASAPVGHLADRIGAVPVLAIGTATIGGVLVLCAMASEIWMFIVGYGVLGALGFTMLSYVPLGVLAGQLFEGRNTGLLYAVLTNGVAVGFIVLVPLWTQLGTVLSWNQILFGVGVVFLVVLVPLSLLLVRSSARPAEEAVPVRRITLWQGIRATFGDKRARGVIIPFIACGITMAFIDVHLFAHMHDHGVPSGIGALSVAVLGALEIIGGLIAGRLCDRGRIRTTLLVAYLVRAGSMLLLPFFSSDVMVVAFGATFGVSYLATVVATVVWLTRIMPPGTRGTAIGLLWTVHMFAVAVGSQAGAILADVQHTYLFTILVSAALTMGAVALVAAQPNPDAAEPEPEEHAPLVAGV